MLYTIWIILFLVVCTVTDIKERRISLWFCIANTIGMFVIHIICRDYNVWNIAGGILIAGVFFCISKFSKEAIGMGDVLMIMTIGIVGGVVYIIEMLFWSFIVCLVFSGVGVIWGKLNLKSKIPFAPFMLMGSIVVEVSRLI